MNRWKSFLMVPAFSAAAAFAQQAPPMPPMPQLPPMPAMPHLPANMDALLEQTNAAIERTSAVIGDLGLSFQNGFYFETHSGDRAQAEYDQGTRALDDHKYDDAVRHFEDVINGTTPRAGRLRDGALYWKAYAQNRLGRRDDALATLTALRHDSPKSRWLKEAQALEAEIKQGAGGAISPAEESNEDIKLMAINSLMNADPDKAVPLLDGILKGNTSPKMKDRALFVLTQNRSPQAQQILVSIAKGADNPDLQVRAIRDLGISGTDDARRQLGSIYSSSNDSAVRQQVLQSLMIARGTDALFNIAKNEKDQQLHAAAIQQLGILHAGDQLMQLYSADSSPDSRREIIRALFIAGAAKDMVDIARRETDPGMKRYIVQQLSFMHSKEAQDYMMELLK